MSWQTVSGSTDRNSPQARRTPAMSRTQIAFVWIVDRQGGEARRLTTQPGAEHTAVFSPDGSQLALTRNVGGNLGVYIVPAATMWTRGCAR